MTRRTRTRLRRHQPNSNNVKIWKCAYLKKNLGVVVDCVDTWFSNFAIEYLRENEKVCETVFACLFVAQIESFKKTKKMLKISWHCPFKWCCKKIDFVKKFVQKIELPIMSNSKFIRGLWIFKIFWFSAVRTGLSKAEKCPRQHWVNLM